MVGLEGFENVYKKVGTCSFIGEDASTAVSSKVSCRRDFRIPFCAGFWLRPKCKHDFGNYTFRKFF